ncbi:hypothetical protein JMUB7554_27560 [Staphylococcus aureus]
MKIKTTVAALSVLSVLSFGAFAADDLIGVDLGGRRIIKKQFTISCKVKFT